MKIPHKGGAADVKAASASNTGGPSNTGAPSKEGAPAHAAHNQSPHASQLAGMVAQNQNITAEVIPTGTQKDTHKQTEEVFNLLEYGNLYNSDPKFAAIVDKFKGDSENGTLNLEEFQNALKEFNKTLNLPHSTIMGNPNYDIELAIDLLGSDPEGAKGKRAMEVIENSIKDLEKRGRNLNPDLKKNLMALLEKYKQMAQNGTFNTEGFQTELQEFFKNNSSTMDPTLSNGIPSTLTRYLGPIKPKPAPSPGPVEPQKSPHENAEIPSPQRGPNPSFQPNRGGGTPPSRPGPSPGQRGF